MTKEYENKAVQAEMVMVDFDTQVEKRAGGTYDGTNIMYKAFGKVNEKGITTKTFEFKPDLRGQLESVNKKGTKFTLNFYREVGGQFWNINDVQEGHVAQQGSPQGVAGGQPAQASSFSGVNPAAVGQAINLAVDALGYKHSDLTDVNKVRKAIIWYKEVKELFSDNWEAADKEPTPQVQKNEEFATDSIPF